MRANVTPSCLGRYLGLDACSPDLLKWRSAWQGAWLGAGISAMPASWHPQHGAIKPLIPWCGHTSRHLADESPQSGMLPDPTDLAATTPRRGHGRRSLSRGGRLRPRRPAPSWPRPGRPEGRRRLGAQGGRLDGR